jgi:hypothetical protein
MSRLDGDLTILVYAVGYEARSGHIAASLRSEKRIAVVFDNHPCLSYAANLAMARARGDALVDANALSEQFEPTLTSAVEAVRASDSGTVRVVVDVSSMPRVAMAIVLLELMRRAVTLGVDVAVAYAVANYAPPQSDPGPYMAFEPLPHCEGWTTHPERPLSAILGLGYEADQAIAAVQYLDPSGVWAFLPSGNDVRFLRDLKRANSALLPLLKTGHRLDYRIKDLGHLYATYRGLVETLCQRSRVVLVPGGPKIFSAISIVIKAQLGDEVSVWRASSHTESIARDASADGSIAVLDIPNPNLYKTSDIVELNAS